MYYLQSRYYNPEIGRFISSDVYTSTGQGLLGNNMFAYCRNSPVFRIDISGTYDLECNDTDPIDDELVHEEGGLSGGNGDTRSNLQNQLSQCANTANSKVPGRGPVAGTLKHTEFANQVNSLDNSNLQIEVSYANGEIVAYGTKGSIRFDVVLYDSSGRPIAAWDFKTGSATLSSSRIEQMHSRSGLSINIYIVR